jgi:hypothetical protein
MSGVAADLSGLMPPAALDLLKSSDATFRLSADNVTMFAQDKTQLYYVQSNLGSSPINISSRVECASKKCPSSIVLDSFWSGEIGASQKKVTTMFIITNNSDLGVFEYTLFVNDSAGKNDSANFMVTVISDNFWVQFWYELKRTIIFWD